MIPSALCYRDRGGGVGFQPWLRGLPVAIARLRLPTTSVRYDMFTQMLNASIFVIAKWHWQLHSQIPSKLSFH